MNNLSSKPKTNSASVALAALVCNTNHCLLYNDVNFIGRSENASLSLHDVQISRKHCIINKLEDNTFTICDTSTSGTFVNNKKLVKYRVHPLNHKDTISFGNQKKHDYIFVLDKNLNMPSDQSEYLNSQMKEKISNLDSSHSTELMKLNRDLCKIDSDKFELQQEMNSKLQDQENVFKAERLSLYNLVTMSQEQKDDADKKLKEMKKKFEAEEKRLKEVESKYAIMIKKEEELQQLKIEMELQHQKDKNELEERCQAKIRELKEKLKFAELEQDRLLEETRDVQQQLVESKKILLESEIEQSRLAEEKGEVETKLFDLTKESTHKDHVVMKLKRQLKKRERRR